MEKSARVKSPLTVLLKSGLGTLSLDFLMLNIHGLVLLLDILAYWEWGV